MTRLVQALAHLVLALVLASVLASGQAAQAGDVVLRIRGHRPDGGSIRVAAFASGADFEAGRATRGVVGPASGSPVRLVLPGLPHAGYAIAAYQDLDGNRELTKSFLGIPQEPYGFSNGARGRFGPPDFARARVTVADAPLTLEIRLE